MVECEKLTFGNDFKSITNEQLLRPLYGRFEFKSKTSWGRVKIRSLNCPVRQSSIGYLQKILMIYEGIARTQSPTNKNYALELPTFGAIVGVSQTEVQWNGLILEEPPSWSRLTSVPGKYAFTWNVKSISLFQILRNFWKEMILFLITFSKQKISQGLSRKSFESGYFRRASNCQSLTGAIPLLTHTGTLGCWVSPLTQYAPS